MEPLDLIQLQISLVYQLGPDGLLLPFPGSTEQAWYLVYQYSQGYVPYFNTELPSHVRQQLLALGPKTSFEDPEKVRKLIDSSHQPCAGGDVMFWSGYISQPPEPEAYRLATRKDSDWVVEKNGKVVCHACSVRQNEQCAEVYVETLPNYRRRGFGRPAVAAWAKHILDSRRVPFYHYRANNTPSAGLASSLNVTWYANVVAYEPMAILP
jgi:hypothetical protein